MKMRLIRIPTTGKEYAMPLTKYSELPCFRIEDGQPCQTSFHFGDLEYLLKQGKAEIVGQLKLTLTLERKA